MAGSRLHVGVAQVDCDLGDVDANLQRHLRFIARARERSLDLLVFPELSLTGYSLEGRVPEVAMTSSDARLAQLAEAAGPMGIVIGFVEEGRGEQFYNAAALIEKGQVTLLHRKLNLPTYGNLDEDKRFAHGQRLNTRPLGSGPWHAALLVCADLWNPALVHLAMLQGANCLLAPIASAVEAVGGQFSNSDGWSVAMRFYSMMYGSPAVMANRVGIEGRAHFWGGSRILDAEGRTLAQAGAGEELIDARIDHADVRRVRFRLPTLRDADTALVQRELTRWIDEQPLA